jgi:hypothetical protein
MEWRSSFRDDGILEIITSGTFILNDFIEMCEELLSDERWKPGTNCLLDHRNLDLRKVDKTICYNATVIHKKHDEKIGKTKIAVIVRGMAGYGIIREAQGYIWKNVQSEIMPFFDSNEALEWLKKDDMLM